MSFLDNIVAEYFVALDVCYTNEDSTGGQALTKIPTADKNKYFAI